MGESKYFDRLASAFVRGRLSARRIANASLFDTSLDDLSAEQIETLTQLGSAAGLKVHKFKRTMGLARVNRVIGILRGLQPESLLDIGSGRGVFLWPALESFPQLPITCLDVNSQRVDDINAVAAGGVSNLIAICSDAQETLPFADRRFDVVTALEVLEHMENPRNAIRELIRVSHRCVIASVPSHEDDNPEHIHLFDAKTLPELFAQEGATRVKTEYVLNHMILVANTRAQ